MNRKLKSRLSRKRVDKPRICFWKTEDMRMSKIASGLDSRFAATK